MLSSYIRTHLKLLQNAQAIFSSGCSEERNGREFQLSGLPIKGANPKVSLGFTPFIGLIHKIMSELSVMICAKYVRNRDYPENLSVRFS